jgi:hypothetical protein
MGYSNWFHESGVLGDVVSKLVVQASSLQVLGASDGRQDACPLSSLFIVVDQQSAGFQKKF